MLAAQLLHGPWLWLVTCPLEVFQKCATLPHIHLTSRHVAACDDHYQGFSHVSPASSKCWGEKLDRRPGYDCKKRTACNNYNPCCLFPPYPQPHYLYLHLVSLHSYNILWQLHSRALRALVIFPSCFRNIFLTCEWCIGEEKSLRACGQMKYHVQSSWPCGTCPYY